MNRDPTRSAGLRRQGRAIVARRVHFLHQGLRQAVQEGDVVGLRSGDAFQSRSAFINWMESVSHKLARTEDMLQSVIDTSLTTPPDWPRELMERSVARGIEQVEQELSTSLGRFDAGEVSRLHASEAASEVRGIAGETQRRLLRHVVRALEAKAKPEALMREIRATLEKVTKLRLNLMINTGVVRAVNAGKLFGYEMLGIRQVGINPEWLPRAHVHKVHDAKKKSAEQQILEAALGIQRASVLELVEAALEETEQKVLVNVLTAGDDLVCEDCEDIAGDGPYDIEEARNLIPAHPNCRCAFVPFGDMRFAPIEEQIEAQMEEFE